MAPPIEPDTQTVIVEAFEGADLRTEVLALSDSGQSLSFDQGQGRGLVQVSIHHETPGALDLSVGRVPELSTQRSYPIPPDATLFQADLDSEEPAWVMIPGEEAAFPQRRLQSATEACGTQGGCWVEAQCQTPCAVARDPAPPMEPEPPAPVDVIDLTPCPDGWRVLTPGEELTLCDPWPEAGPTECAHGAHFLGDAACTEIGGPCPAGSFATNLPAGATVFVSASATPGGNGNQNTPFSTIDDALAAVADGGTVVIGKGTYTGNWSLDRDIDLLGACPAETIFTAANDAAAVLSVTGNVEVRGLRFEGSGVRVDAGGSLGVTDSIVSNVSGVGVRAVGASLALTDVLITETSSHAMSILAQSQLTANRVVASGARRFGLYASDNSQVDAQNIAIRSDPADAGARGMGFYLGATGDVREALVESSRLVSVYIRDAGTRVSMSDLIVYETYPTLADGSFGDGFEVIGGAQLDLVRARIASSARNGFLIADPGTVTNLSQVLVDRPFQDTQGSNGLIITRTASVTADHLMVLDRPGEGVRVDESASLTGTDIRIRDLRTGAGLVAVDSGVLIAERAEVRHVIGVGAVSAQQGQLTLKDLSIDTISEAPSVGLPAALALDLNGQLTVDRADVTNVTFAAAVLGAGTADLSNIRFHDLAGGAVATIDTPGGNYRLSRVVAEKTRGILVAQGNFFAEDLRVITTSENETIDCLASSIFVLPRGNVELSRVAIEDAFGVGVHVEGSLVATDLAIRGVRSQIARCDPEAESPEPARQGIGVQVFSDGSAQIERLSIFKAAVGGSFRQGSTARIDGAALELVTSGFLMVNRRAPEMLSGVTFEEVEAPLVLRE